MRQKRNLQKPYSPIGTVAVGFRPEFLDFQRGIHVGNLEDHERITRILKLGLESRYRQPFVTQRWGRGVYWQWIGYLPRANREAKPVSHNVSFGCSKFFLSLHAGEKLFTCGLQVERGYVRASPDFPACKLARDWDWHRLVGALKPGSAMERELGRLVLREGFRIRAGSWEAEPVYFSKSNFPGVSAIKRQIQKAPAARWAGFQLFYAMDEAEVKGSTGRDLVESMMAVFEEVTPAMNLCMQIKLS